MITKFMTTAGLVAALALAPAERAEADAAEFIGGAIIGGVIGHALSQNNRTTRTTTTTTRVVRPSIPATQQGRETQTALNYFGFNAGVVDGQIGGGTRAAIERFQGTMGYPVNGREFSSWQFDFLMDAYYWGTTVGASQTGLRNTQLLYAFRDQVQNGGTLQSGFQGGAAPQPPTTVIVNPAPVAPPAPAPAVGTTVSAPAPAVPNLFANASPTASLANTCNSVMLQTSTNGGYVTMASMADPSFALSEQFCVARSYAMARGEELMQDIVGFTQAQITEQCGGFSTMFSSQIDSASLVGEAELLPQVRSVAMGTGIPPADLTRTARVCLSVGYRQDDMRMAVGSALALVAMGEAAYGELMGHHLREGFGTTARPDLAMGWYNASLMALETGATAAFMPGQPERVQLLRLATMRLNGGGAAPAPVPASQPAPSNGLPTFTISQ
jgi:peptidoglycan hydrolase-like protein with peptidoglycan-binding domain